MKKRRILIFSALTVLALLAVSLYRSNFCLQVDRYRVASDKVTGEVRIVQLSDLHNTRFGRENQKLIAAVAAEQPDLILFTGDLVTGDVEDTATAEVLLKALSRLAPVYVSLGNHEISHDATFSSDLTARFEAAGAKVLELAHEDITLKGQRLRIGGASGYCVEARHLETGEAKIEECEFLWAFAKTDACRILMCHMPHAWQMGGLESWDVDFVFSGHAHGGQWVLPWLGPVYAPDMGYFPGKTEGIFEAQSSGARLVLSSGLGNSIPIPRFNNPPQILVLDIAAE